MAEELALTDPVVVPEQVTTKYRVVSLTLDLEAATLPAAIPGAIFIRLRDNHNESSSERYEGQTAQDMIRFLNTANLSVKSMHKRILERLAQDYPEKFGGTVVGAPDA